ncbi:MAG: N-acetylmuramoyl-L-alanine amidase [Anaerolineae bacterium]|nr:N-acetylmuramoyl-L-alanine amidase [Anaerolineae bacterium]
MQANRNQTTWQAQPFLLIMLRRNMPLLFYLLLAAGTMLGVYWFFQPDAGASAAAVSAPGEEGVLAAPIFKKVPARPVVQRFAQSPGPLHIALVAGHRDHDSGAVCDDGLTEAAVNQLIAEKVRDRLAAADVRSEIFSEFDPRLYRYSGTALVSLHADSCDYINELATGFKLSGSTLTDSTLLSTCVEAAYAQATGLPYHANTITIDMQDYHAFREIAPGVPAIILETGFMGLDRELLTTGADVPAAGIAEGILCFLEGSGR